MSVLIRLRLARRVVDVSVRDDACPTLECFEPQHDGWWDCASRAERGCPALVRLANPVRYSTRGGAAWRAVTEEPARRAPVQRGDIDGEPEPETEYARSRRRS